MLVIVGVKCREGFLHTVPITPVDNTFGYMIADKLGWTPEGRRARGRPKTTWSMDSRERLAKQRWVEELGSTQSGCTRQKALVRQREGLLRLLAR